MATDTATAPDAPAPAGRKGRPRTQASLAREAGVLRLLAAGPKTASALASELNLPKNGDAYYTIYVLRNGRGRKENPLVQRVAGSRTTYELTEAGRAYVATLPA